MAEQTTASWYIVHTQTGHEDKVKKKILLDAQTHNMSELILQALVPTEEVREVKQNKEIKHQRKFFPGYVLVEIATDPATQEMGVAARVPPQSAFFTFLPEPWMPAPRYCMQSRWPPMPPAPG